MATTALPALAADLTIGRSSEQSSIDPQFSRTGNNQMTAEMIFGRLVDFDQNLQMHPGLAASWKNIDPLTWEITLRPGVTFQDGSPLTRRGRDLLAGPHRQRAEQPGAVHR